MEKVITRNMIFVQDMIDACKEHCGTGYCIKNCERYNACNTLQTELNKEVHLRPREKEKSKEEDSGMRTRKAIERRIEHEKEIVRYTNRSAIPQLHKTEIGTLLWVLKEDYNSNTTKCNYDVSEVYIDTDMPFNNQIEAINQYCIDHAGTEIDSGLLAAMEALVENKKRGEISNG